MAKEFFARQLLTTDGWVADARVRVAGGRIDSIHAGTEPALDDTIAGIVIPGLANAHSHAFQRALAGHTEQRGPAGTDNFWTWRTRMYELAERVDCRSLTDIARQAYVEMVAAGYTSVAEFHYLHREHDKADSFGAMFDALAEAAGDAGIRLTYVPVLYERAGFDLPLPDRHQQQFAVSVAALIEHYERAAARLPSGGRIGLGVHSLRAVTAESLAAVAGRAAADGVPMHIHIAEQQREVDQCVAAYGMRPVEWLLDRFDVSENWCLVHATHIDVVETERLAASGAVVCICPSTEANLGDGLFPLRPFLEAGGRLAIGSDSHVSINPFEELRWLEYGQRLVTLQRNVAAIRRPETGRSLFELACQGGAMATGAGSGGIASGSDADLVVLDDDSPMMSGHTNQSFLEALVFSGFSLPIDRVMVNGEWVVANGRHSGAEAAGAAYRRTALRLLEARECA